jgi:hypothetical protein
VEQAHHVAEEVDLAHTALAVFEGTVFWGRWWERAEEKHFEIWLAANEFKGCRVRCAAAQ